MITRTPSPSPSPSLRLFARGICGLPTGASPWQQLSIILQRDSSASVSAFAAQSTATEQPPIWLNVTIMCMQICVCVCVCVCVRVCVCGLPFYATSGEKKGIVSPEVNVILAPVCEYSLSSLPHSALSWSSYDRQILKSVLPVSAQSSAWLMLTPGKCIIPF